MDDLPPHSAYYNYTHEQENHQTNDDVLDLVLTMTVCLNYDIEMLRSSLSLKVAWRGREGGERERERERERQRQRQRQREQQSKHTCPNQQIAHALTVVPPSLHRRLWHHTQSFLHGTVSRSHREPCLLCLCRVL